jgi:hypothetical protein
MKFFKKICTIFLLLLMAACTEKIDLHIEDANQNLLVVDGMITSDTTSHLVMLTRTGSFYTDIFTPRVSGAEVIITDDAGNTFPLTENAPGAYRTAPDVYGVVGRTYTLSIYLDDAHYMAQSTMKRVPDIDSLGYRWDPFKQSYRILLYGQEPEGKGDFYMWHLYKNDRWMTNTIVKTMVASDEFIDGNYISGFEVDWWSQDFDFQSGDTVVVAQHTINQQAYEFFMAIRRESTAGGSMPLNPPANVASNVSNGALGLFHASALTRKEIVIGQ